MQLLLLLLPPRNDIPHIAFILRASYMPLRFFPPLFFFFFHARQNSPPTYHKEPQLAIIVYDDR